ncbi:DUF2577 domain-containing protein [Holdemania massiliensis]|uniref:DUF2577 domain-containing protein n=2 Tax=Holdemania massiliensis TaxID=1468449 RepID=A0A6N7SBE7_9FIRM|nr:DUF2577 domain-containing protein [Holdemania massiliensis]MSA91177.1 DUF2577 domain-containing protein [Holdemania massiliensis]MSB80020.1 DUF2577 domain-containing protein [Holdemania massiliensis]MSC34941.1 DUF2577 domain-containing protein [Holdemania massiliensis]MSC41330.1 DUF2577 domain-containing protein [Holdemania massiliensis]
MGVYDMASLYDAIKKAVAAYMDNAGLSDLLYATLVSAAGSIRIEKTGVVIPSNMVDLPDQYTNRQVDITIDDVKKTITLHDQLPVGSRVVVIKKQGGQRYAIVGRLP